MAETQLRACTYNKRNVIFMSNVGQTLKVGNTTARVADALNEKQLGLLVDVLGILLPRLQLGPSHLNTEAREQGLEKAVGAAVQVDRRHDIVTGSGKADDGIENCCLSGTCAHGRGTTL